MLIQGQQESIMGYNADRVAEMKQLLDDDAPVGIVDGKPVPLGAFELVNGVFVDKAGQPVAAVKPHTWY